LFTPVTGQNLSPGWEADRALAFAHLFYPELEKTLGLSFYQRLPTWRFFSSEEQRDAWVKKSPRELLPAHDVAALPVHAPLGGTLIDGGGWVDLHRLLDALRARREARGEWAASPDVPARITVWANGYQAATHPLWREAGWRNAHGDVLTLRIPGLPADRIYGFDRFLLPLGGDLFRCGATYRWDHDDPAPTTAGRQELERSLAAFLRVPFEVVGHQAGIRPIALARAPLLGPHPDAPDQWIFNGFGSKGVLHAPWLAEALVSHLREGTPVHKETWAPRRIQRQRDREATRVRLGE
jgi:glycine/D-amino acid oxidase-like deaminating enzyme